MPVVVETLEDKYEWRLANAYKMTAVNSKQMNMMPWEALSIEPGAVRDLDTFMQIPGKLMSKIAATRDSIKDLFGPGPHTFVQMQNELRRHTADFKKLSRSVVCDIRLCRVALRRYCEGDFHG